MTLHELLKSVTWPEVSESLTRIFGEDAVLSVCERAYNELLTTEPKKNGFAIRIKVPGDNENEYPNVYGYDEAGKRWGLDFVPWEEWLGMEVRDMIWTKPDIVACCIWEMTFYGPTSQAVQDRANELYESAQGKCTPLVEWLKNHLDTTPIEEVVAGLKEANKGVMGGILMTTDPPAPMKVYQAVFSDCIFECLPGTISIHLTREGAQKAIEEHRESWIKTECDPECIEEDLEMCVWDVIETEVKE